MEAKIESLYLVCAIQAIGSQPLGNLRNNLFLPYKFKPKSLE